MRSFTVLRRREAGITKRKNGLLSVIEGIIRHSKLLTFGLVLTIAGAIISGLLPPLVLERIVNDLADGTPVVFQLALLYFAALALAGLFDAVKEVLITIFGQKTTRGLRHEMCAKLSRLPASYFITNEPGVTVSRFVGDVDTVEALFASGIIGMIVDTCKVISILIVIFVKSKGLGILMLLVTPLIFLMTRLFQRRMLDAQLANRIAVGKVNNHVPETIGCIRMVRTFHKQKYMADRYDGYIQESYRAVEKSNFYDSVYSPIILVINAVIIAAMMVMSSAGGEMRAFFGMSVGTAVAIIAYVGRVFEPIESIGMEIQNIQSAVAGVHRINEFLDEPERGNTDASITCENLKKSGTPAIELIDVDFGYDSGRKVLQNLSFVLQPGENVTLTGRTGIGKSTIFKLLLGLYSPDGGNVLIYGADAEKIPDKEKRKLFGYVEQSFRLVPGTVEEQITLYDPAVTHADAEKAAKMVGLHDSIAALPDGYSTPCTEALFSQGQMQLLAIARAVTLDPAILLLDEITANLDSDTEERVLKALQKASENRTVISISHRLYEHTGGRRISLDTNTSE